MASAAEEVKQVYHKHFQGHPFLFFSPGRINLIGEHVDYNDGFVMPAAIDKGIWFAAAPNNTGTAHIYSADKNEKLDIDLGHIEKSTGWKNYLLGVLYFLQQRGFQVSGFNAVFGGNLPVGAGLSSSAAVECGLAFALNTIFGFAISRKDIALLCQQAEHHFPGVLCGIMDQYANMIGVKDHVLLLDCNNVTHEVLPFYSDEYEILLINSKVHHALEDGAYNKRRSQCEEGMAVLKSKLENVQTFRDISTVQLQKHKHLLDEVVHKRCSYVVAEIERTKQAAELLKKHHMGLFGELMFETHAGLKDLYDVSCTELDFLVEKAKQHAGIAGARLMGGGFGGCTINLVKKGMAEKIVADILPAYKNKFGFDAEHCIVHPADGTYKMD